MKPILPIAMALMLAVSPLAIPPAAAQGTPDAHQWDGLLRVKAKKMDAVYLLPNADFRGYTKVLLEPTEVSFRKDWQRDTNRDTMDRISDADARKILDEARQGFDTIFRKAYEAAGYQVVTESGPDVLRIRTAVVNLDIEAPDTSVGITRTYTQEAGGAMLVVEARDSVSGQLLGRAVDAQSTSEFGMHLRNRASNTADFEVLFDDWAKASAKGLTELKELSPIDATGKLARH